jgi:hypothetical protein
MKPVNGSAVVRHDKRVKGGQFKTSADVVAPGQDVLAPVSGKVAHVYKDKTHCGNPDSSSCQITMSEEVIRKGDRHLTGRRVGLAHFTPVAGLSQGALRHVAAGTVIGVVSGDSLHVSTNKPEMMAELV